MGLTVVVKWAKHLAVGHKNCKMLTVSFKNANRKTILATKVKC